MSRFDNYFLMKVEDIAEYVPDPEPEAEPEAE